MIKNLLIDSQSLKSGCEIASEFLLFLLNNRISLCNLIHESGKKLKKKKTCRELVAQSLRLDTFAVRSPTKCGALLSFL